MISEWLSPRRWVTSDRLRYARARWLRQLLEEKKKKKEQQAAILNELLELEFPQWELTLTQDDLKAILPENIFQSRLSAAKTSMLRGYYRDNILIPKLKEQGIFGS